jgi:hypothetical protein
VVKVVKPPLPVAAEFHRQLCIKTTDQPKNAKQSASVGKPLMVFLPMLLNYGNHAASETI